MAEVKTSPFIRGKKQLEKVQVDWSCQLSAVRIHVERAKTEVHHFTRDPPIQIILVLTMQLLRVCCALVNLCPSVITQ